MLDMQLQLALRHKKSAAEVCWASQTWPPARRRHCELLAFPVPAPSAMLHAVCQMVQPHSRPALPCVQEYNDAMLTVFMSSLTKGVQGINEIVDKHTIAYERSSRRRGMG